MVALDSPLLLPEAAAGVAFLSCSERREEDRWISLGGGVAVRLVLALTLTWTRQFFGMFSEGVDCDSGIHPDVVFHRNMMYKTRTKYTGRRFFYCVVPWIYRGGEGRT